MNTIQWNKIRYTLYAPFYNLIEKMISKARKRSIDVLDIKPKEKVLIAGVGTGLDFKYISKDVDLTAIDLTPAMIKLAEKEAKSLGLNADLQVMNAQEMSFNDEQFDCVILHLTLAIVPDPIACIKEVERVLKKGGRVVIFDKFLDDDKRPTLLRKFAGVITNFLFSDINRQLGPIISKTSLKIEMREPSMLGGTFIIAKAIK